MNKKEFKTTIGGQALIEGIMMKSPQKSSMAVRRPDGEIEVEVKENKVKKISKIPFIRGVYTMLTTLISGYGYLMRSAEISMTEEEQEEEKSKFELWLNNKFGEKVEKAYGVIALLLAMVLSLVLFMLVPTYLAMGVDYLVPLGNFRSLVEGLFKLLMFLVYLILTSRLKDVRRTFSYHGAEHKTIFCYEAGEELTVENIKRFSRFHPRCGTSFLLIVIVISVLVNAPLTWENAIIRVVYKLILLPLVVSVSYEIIRIAGRFDNILTRIISAPGMWMQNFTTYEPDDSMIEVAIAALEPVLPKDKNDAIW